MPTFNGAVKLYFSCQLLLVLGAAFEIKVKVFDDEGKETEKHIYRVDDETPPPFQTPPEADDRLQDGWMSRHARSVMDMQGFKRQEPHCSNFVDVVRQKTNMEPVHLAVITEPQQDLQLTCYYCGNPEEYRNEKVLRWMKIEREKTGNVYVANEIIGDMHDDDSKNRIVFTDDFSLIIRNMTQEDAGTYICQMLKVHDGFSLKEYTYTQLVDLYKSKDRIRFQFHVDVLMPSKIPAIKVSNFDKKYPKPMMNEFVMKHNIKYFTTWGEWAACSVCDQPGERRRHGTCTISLINKDEMINPPYVYFALKNYKPGIPCRTSLFQNYPFLKNRPDEIEITSCSVKCPIQKKLSAMNATNLESITFRRKRVVPKLVKVFIGGYIAMYCTGASLDSIVYWVIGNDYVTSFRFREMTDGRGDIDAHNVLFFNEAKYRDSNIYTCWYGGKERAAFDLKVVYPSGEAEWFVYYKFVLLSFGFDFLLFLILMAVRHKHRHVQIARKKR